MSTPRSLIKRVLCVIAIVAVFAALMREESKAAHAQGTDPIPGYLSQVSEANLTNYVTALVGYGPRLVNAYQVYTDASCTPNGTNFAENNLDRAANYAKGVFDAMGYTAVLETVPGYGHNVVVTKTGTVYPNIYIEFGAHLDTKPGTPGGNDNGSGSAAVMELARVLRNYPSRYSMTFALWVGEETGGFAGSYHHVDQMLAEGKQIKAGLNIDNMGQIGIGTPNFYRNDIWTNNADSLRIWDIMNLVNNQYSLGLTLVNNGTPCTACSDHYPYWQRGLTAVTSVGGWTPSSPNYHQCGDVVAAYDSTQATKVTQQNLAAALKLDLDVVPPTVTLALSSNTVPANGSSTVIATATVRDSNNNPLTSETVTFTTSGDVSISAVTNHGDGTYSVIVTASTTAGSETITATDSGVSATAHLVETTYCPGACFTDTTITDFGAGTPGTSTYVAQMGEGEVILQPTVGTEFSSSSLPVGWMTSAWGSGTQSVTFNEGWVTLHNAMLNTSATFGPGRTIEFAARFGGGTYQFGGFSDNGSSPPWAGFDFDAAGTTLTANENNTYITNIPGTWVGASHRYRIDWNVAPNAGDIVYYIDGVEVARHAHPETGSMRPMFTDYAADGRANQVDWIHMSPYASSGMFYSRVFDGGGAANWGIATWTAETPSGTSLVIRARSGNTPTPDGSWSGFNTITNGASIGVHARYLQYTAELSTSNSSQTPVLNEISLRYSPDTVGPPTKLGFIAQPAGAIAGSPFATQPVVAVQDASGYTVSSDNSTQVTLAIGTNPAGGVLICTANPVTVINGVANFAGCRISIAGTGYTLIASGGSLTSATSASFNVTHVAPASLSLTLSPDTLSANGISTSIATATVRDAGGNPLVGETVVFSTNGDVTFGPVTDNGNGTYNTTVTASTSPGDETITATDSPVNGSATLHETANCPGTCFTDTTSTNFLAGTPGSATYVAQTDDGEVILSPTVGAEFFGTTPSTGWTVLPYGGGSPNVTVSSGKVNIGTARLRADGLYGPGHVLEYVATHTGGLYQASGLGYSFDGGDGYVWATFDTAGVGNALNTNTNGAVTSIPGSWLNSPHRYRIEWTSSGVVYYIDGVQRDSKSATFTRDMRPMFADNVADSNLLQVDWVRMTPYAATGTFLSRVFDGGGSVAWGTASWTADTPSGTNIVVSVRSGNTPNPDGTWSSFIPVTNGASVGVTARYLQYQAVLSTSNADLTPTLKYICIAYIDNVPPTIISRLPAPNATGIALNTTISIGFSEPMLASTVSASTVRLRASDASSDVLATVTYVGTTATLTPNAALAPGRQYQVTVAGSVSDLSGNAMGSDVTWTFTTASAQFTDNTAADFSAGTPGSATYIAQMSDGEVILQPALASEFSGTSLPSDWSSTGSVGVSGGWLTLNGGGATARSIATFGPGRTIEYGAILGGGQYQAVGFASSVESPPYVVFDFVSSDGATLYAFYNAGSGNNGPVIPGEWRNTSHRYSIDWGASNLVYSIDGTPRATLAAAISGNMYAFLSAQSQVLRVDWVRMTPYASSGMFTSRVFNAGEAAEWLDLTWVGSTPTGTSISFETRTGNSAVPDGTWSAWQAVNSPIASPNGQYIQYRATLATTDPQTTPVVERVTIAYRAASSPPPPLPSRFYGEIYLEPTPQVGDLVQVQIGSVSRVITTAIASQAGTLTYQIDVPGDVSGTPDKEGGTEGEVITFTLGSRVVATGMWHSGTNTRLDFHSSSVALQPGWNLVSFNLRPVSTAITDVLSSLVDQYDLVYAWNGASQAWSKYDDVAMTQDTLTRLDETLGFWIHITTTAQSLTVFGSLPTTTAITLSGAGSGWNLVGFPSNVTRALPNALSDHGVGTNFSLVYAYHANDSGDPWKLFDRSATYSNDLAALTPGWGYWIQTPITNTWTIAYPAP